jgi:hypothetical protein
VALVFLTFSLLAAAFYMQKIFLHYSLIRENDRELRNKDFGDFFYSAYFSKKRILVSLKLSSLRLIDNNTLLDKDNVIPRLNIYIKLVYLFISLAGLTFLIGYLTNTIK